MKPVDLPPSGDTWVALADEDLDAQAAIRWATRPSCGAVVSFLGTARDHSEGREGVVALDYEAYEGEVERRLHAVDESLRARWPEVERVALLHRRGRVELGEPAVVVVVSSPHRDAAFEAGRFAIDTLKETVPIWKREHGEGGASWARDTQHVTEVADLTGVEG